VLNATVKPVREADVEKAINDVTFGPGKPFDAPRPLREIAGSLQRVYRYLDPGRHFSRKVNALRRDDYRAIVDGKVEIPRSIFRYLFSALPLAVQSEFVRTYPGSFPRTAQGYVTQYSALCRELFTFLDTRVRVPLQLLADTAAAYATIRRAGVPSFAVWRLLPEVDGGEVSHFGVQRSIPFGATALEASRMTEANPLFGGASSRGILLAECRRELEELDGKERRWRDPVF
jgi:hypothetical protein